MKKLIYILISVLVGVTVSYGATVEFATPVALFETTLASRITTTDTSMTLTSATTKDGTTLASSTYGFIIDEGTASEEFVLADCTATACTNMTRGVSVVTGTSSVTALKQEHRRGASVKITDAPLLVQIARILLGAGKLPSALTFSATQSVASSTNQIPSAVWVFNNFVNKYDAQTVAGVKTFSAKPILSAGGTSSVEPSAATDIATKNYVDNVANQGAATATPSVAGISRLSVAAVNALDPIVVGNNDPRVKSTNAVYMVSTTSNHFVFKPAGYGTSTLQGIPFGTSTVIDIYVASSTRDLGANTTFGIRFNNDSTGGHYAFTNTGMVGSTISDGGSGTTQGAAVLPGDQMNYYRLTINNSTSSIKTILVNGMLTNSSNHSVRTIVGHILWENTTEAINRIDFGSDGTTTVGSTTITAIVTK